MLVIQKEKPTTRSFDFEDLEQGISEVREERKDGLKMMLELIYEQSKDETLERYRKLLTDASLKNDHIRMKAIEQKIKAYTKDPKFMAKMARALTRVAKEDTISKAKDIFKSHV